ncbi:uncharacterized protein LOC141910697 [Tubulanus polymorphus]|uniref:uncharacterized protein LOC141910697 n=1 Tax=Tubulanus polymorphus TaxID=672921 RepID=UPI003DA4C3DD
MWRLAVLFGVLFSHCFVMGSDVATEEAVYTHLPERILPPTWIHIRTSFKGWIRFIESPDFQIRINVTASSVMDLSRVKHHFVNQDGKALLQVYDEAPAEKLLAPYIALTVIVITVLVMVASIIYVCWWNRFKRPYIKSFDWHSDPGFHISGSMFLPVSSSHCNLMSKTVSDSTQAPLLNMNRNNSPVKNQYLGSEAKNEPNALSQMQMHSRTKRKKRRKPRPVDVDEYQSSEEESIDHQVWPPGRSIIGREKYKAAIDSELQDSETDVEGMTRKIEHTNLKNEASMLGSETKDKLKDDMSGDEDRAFRQVQPAFKIQDVCGGQELEPLEALEQLSNDSDQFDGDRFRAEILPVAEKQPGAKKKEKRVAWQISPTSGHCDVEGSPKSNQGHGTQSPSCCIPDFILDNQRSTDMNRSSNGTMSSSSASSVITVINADDHSSPTLFVQGKPANTCTRAFPNTRGAPPSYNETFAPHRSTSANPVSLSTFSSGSGSGSGSGSVSSSNNSLYSKPKGSKPPVPPKRAMDTILSERSSPTSVFGNPYQPPHVSYGPIIRPEHQDDPNPGDDSGVGSSNGDTDTCSGQRSADRLPRAAVSSGIATTRSNSSSYGSGSGGITSLPMTSFTILMVFGIVAGVYAAIDETTVDITVYAPRGVIRNGSKLFSHNQRRANLDTTRWHKHNQVIWYEVESPYLPPKSDTSCSHKRCSKGCDSVTGQCICPRGYRPIPNEPLLCVDVNECRHSFMHQCSSNASCYNTNGSYMCVCKDGYFGDGRNCRDCNQPCSIGMFEVVPCKGGKPKLCESCRKFCNEEEYISQPCGEKSNTICKACTRKCGPHEYEHAPCVHQSDRECRDVLALPEPKGSKNVLMENLSKVKTVRTSSVYFMEKNNTFVLDRGSGYVVKIELKAIYLTPLYRAVNHFNNHDNSAFYGMEDIIKQFCPYPMADMFELSVVLHKNLTSVAVLHKCNIGEKCDLVTGYYLDPYTQCKTYKQFGKLPGFRNSKTIPCSQPNELTDMFGVTQELKQRDVFLVDHSARCDRLGAGCQTCSNQCGAMIENHPLNNQCAVTADESDNGYSPRLEHCYSCCALANCTNVCSGYYAKDCKPTRCISGNIAEFKLKPIFSKKLTKFTCHVEAEQNQILFDLDYKLYKDGKLVKKYNLTKRQSGGYASDTKELHNFLTVRYGSKVDPQPSLVEGDVDSKVFRAGYYDNSGSLLKDARVTVSGSPLKVKPLKPFAINSKNWGNYKCNETIMEQLVLANTSPFKPLQDLNVQYLQHGLYRILNRKDSPYLNFAIEGDTSIIETFHKPTFVRRDTLAGSLLINPNSWVVEIKGQVKKCPGSFKVKISDKINPKVNLFYHDIGVQCPKQFDLLYSIPAREKGVNKTYQVEIDDKKGKVVLTLFHSAEQIQEPIKVPISRELPEHILPMILPQNMISFGLVAAGVLIFLLFIGNLVSSPFPIQKDNNFKLSHLVIFVLYMGYRTAFSLLMTLTALFLLTKAINSDALNILQQYPRHRELIASHQETEIKKIQSFVVGELNRQNLVAEQIKTTCEKHMAIMHKSFEQAMNKIPDRSAKSRARLILGKVAIEHAQKSIQQLSQQLTQFRTEFNIYAEETVYNLIQDIGHTYKSIENNKWLSAARIIHDSVRTARANSRIYTIRKFMDWVGLETELNYHHLVADLKIRADLPLPRVADFPVPDLTKPGFVFTPVNPAMISLPRNVWLIHVENDTDTQYKHYMAQSSPKSEEPFVIIDTNIVLAVLIVLDVLWLLHRAARTHTFATEILYGYPVNYDCCVTANGPTQTEKLEMRRYYQICLDAFKQVGTKIFSTDFLPKLVATGFTSCLVVIFLTHADRLVTLDTLESLGYFGTLVAPLSTNHRVAVTRISANADRINNAELKFYQKSLDARLKHYQILLQKSNQLHCESEAKLTDQYCAWSGKEHHCKGWSYETVQAKFTSCSVPKVIPKLYNGYEEHEYVLRYRSATSTYVNATRQLLMNVSLVVLVYLTILVIGNLFSEVTWIYLKRFNCFRQRRAYKTEEMNIVKTPGESVFTQ